MSYFCSEINSLEDLWSCISTLSLSTITAPGAEPFTFLTNFEGVNITGERVSFLFLE